ncbi:DNA-binding protein [Campylobacter ureolyticus]|uniref:Helix-turn-helix domain-containing protein n=1 Tax=Campylobacter ureolyticus TaxID=827 RepID=A0A6N2RVY2_9BACT
MQIKKQKGKMPKLASSEPNILSPNDLVKNYGLSISTQNRLRLRKRQENDEHPIPFVKIGKRIIYQKDQIEEWLNNIQKQNSIVY